MTGGICRGIVNMLEISPRWYQSMDFVYNIFRRHAIKAGIDRDPGSCMGNINHTNPFFDIALGDNLLNFIGNIYKAFAFFCNNRNLFKTYSPHSSFIRFILFFTKLFNRFYLSVRASILLPVYGCKDYESNCLNFSSKAAIISLTLFC